MLGFEVNGWWSTRLKQKETGNVSSCRVQDALQTPGNSQWGDCCYSLTINPVESRVALDPTAKCRRNCATDQATCACSSRSQTIDFPRNEMTHFLEVSGHIMCESPSVSSDLWAQTCGAVSQSVSDLIFLASATIETLILLMWLSSLKKCLPHKLAGSDPCKQTETSQAIAHKNMAFFSFCIISFTQCAVLCQTQALYYLEMLDLLWV